MARRAGQAAVAKEAPALALREALLARMDQEYQSYRQAVLQAVDTAEDLVRMDLRSLRDDVAEMRARLAALESRLAGAPPAAPATAAAPPGTSAAGVPTGAPFTAPDAAGLPGPAAMAARRRIRWGSSPDTVRDTVFAQLSGLVDDPDLVSTELIKQRIPSMLRWIYGERAVFKGIEGLRREFREHWFARRSAAGASGPVAGVAAANGTSEEAMVSAGSA